MVVPSEVMEVVFTLLLSVCLSLLWAGLVDSGCTIYLRFTRLEQGEIDMLGGLMTLVSSGRCGILVAFSSILCSSMLPSWCTVGKEVKDLGRDFDLASIPSLMPVSMGDTTVVSDRTSVLVVLMVLPHPVPTVEAGAASFGKCALLEWKIAFEDSAVHLIAYFCFCSSSSSKFDFEPWASPRPILAEKHVARGNYKIA